MNVLVNNPEHHLLSQTIVSKKDHNIWHWKSRDMHNTVKPVLRGQLWDKEKVTLQDRWPLKRGSFHMKFSMTGQEKVTFKYR